MNTIFTNNRMNAILNNERFCDTLVNAAARWIDEKEYEDINDYAEAFENILNEIGNVSYFNGEVKMTKRPFGIKFIAPYLYTLKDGRHIAFNSELAFTYKISTGELTWNVKPIKK